MHAFDNNAATITSHGPLLQIIVCRLLCHIDKVNLHTNLEIKGSKTGLVYVILHLRQDGPLRSSNGTDCLAHLKRTWACSPCGALQEGHHCLSLKMARVPINEYTLQ